MKLDFVFVFLVCAAPVLFSDAEPPSPTSDPGLREEMLEGVQIELLWMPAYRAVVDDFEKQLRRYHPAQIYSHSCRLLETRPDLRHTIETVPANAQIVELLKREFEELGDFRTLLNIANESNWIFIRF